MCGRYHLDVNSLYEEDIEREENFEYKNNFNITPQSKVPLVIDDKLKIATWGYFPEWLKSQKNSKPLFNTRWETVREKRTFQSAYKKHRCLVPISGWYEWKNINNEKQPYYFYKENELLKAAGLYWLRSSGNVEFSIITKEAYGDLSSIHHRTHLILGPHEQDMWTSQADDNILYEDIYNQG